MNALKPGKVVCVGRNYVAHAREMGNDVPDRPLIFLKPSTAIIGDGDAIVLPEQSQRVEHEAEIGIVIGARAKNVSEGEALNAVVGYVPLNDVTARDLQKLDVQFTRSKGFDTFCPIGRMVPALGLDWRAFEILCRVNGQLRQHGSATDMVFGIPMLISFISHVMTLEPGDVIATGTPEGVGPIQAGDIVDVELAGLGRVRNPVVAFR